MKQNQLTDRHLPLMWYTLHWVPDGIHFRFMTLTDISKCPLAYISYMNGTANVLSGSQSELQAFTPKVKVRVEWDLFSVSVYTSWNSSVYSAANGLAQMERLRLQGSMYAGCTRACHNPK